MIVALFLSLNLAAHALPASTVWPQLAERMTGESDRVRDECIKDLRAIPNLETLLKSELRTPSQASRTRMYLALDVITTLKLQSLLPDLIKLSEDDPSGYLYHAINTLVTPQNRAGITDLYRDRVTNSRTSPAARMALLDTLSRFGSALSADQIKELLRDPYLGVRQTALSYARTFLLRGSRADYLPLVTDQLQRGSFFTKVQVVYLLHELQRRKHFKLGAWQDLCRADASETVRQLCLGNRGAKR